MSRCLLALATSALASLACTGTSAAPSQVVSSRATFVPACIARTGSDSGQCRHVGKCDALFSCIESVVEPASRDAVLQCETENCLSDEKRACLARIAQRVVDPGALAWASTCNDRAGAAGVSDDPCQKGAAILSGKFRQDFDRCLTLAKGEASSCVKALTEVCQSTYF
jgi:hypothetical protein